MSELLSISFKKEWCQWFACDSHEKNEFFFVFDSFPPFIYQKSDRIHSLLLLFTKEWLWANRSRHSLQKNDREQIAPVALYKRMTVSESLPSLFTEEWPWVILSFPIANSYFVLAFGKSNRSDLLFFKIESLFRSFAHKKKRFARKSKERIPTPEFWLICVFIVRWVATSYTYCTV